MKGHGTTPVSSIIITITVVAMLLSYSQGKQTCDRNTYSLLPYFLLVILPCFRLFAFNTVTDEVNKTESPLASRKMRSCGQSTRNRHRKGYVCGRVWTATVNSEIKLLSSIELDVVQMYVSHFGNKDPTRQSNNWRMVLCCHRPGRCAKPVSAIYLNL